MKPPIVQAILRSLVTCVCVLVVCATQSPAQGLDTDSLQSPGEKHLKNIRQLTFGGENAEAYFSFAEDRLVFQSTRDSFQCDQIYVMDIQGGGTRLLSTGTGKTTCAYFLPGDSTFLYSSTHHRAPTCPPRPDYSKGYVWPVLKTYDIFVASVADGTILHQLTDSPSYDAEATVSPLGDRIVFTSSRDGDLDLYSMKLDGSDVQRLTNEIGYDGGAFYSWDGSKIVYRAHHPETDDSKRDFQQLLAEGLVRPTVMEIWVMNADGSDKRQLTNLGAASFAPFFHPDGRTIIFASNRGDPRGRNFDLYTISIDGTGLEQITFNETFDSFPMFTHDGKRLVFASNRHGRIPGETNIFIADWVP
jgi:TolB protein